METESDTQVEAAPSSQEVQDLMNRTKMLEQELTQIRRDSQARIIQAELKAEAVRAGMIDLDGLKLIDTSELNVETDDFPSLATSVMQKLRKAKPWLFGGASSSTSNSPPLAQARKMKLATEMSDSEYRAARAAIISQSM